MNIQFINRTTGKIEQETPPGEGFLKFIYENPIGKLTLLPLVKRKLITSIYGTMMDKPSSVKKIPSFVQQLGIDLSEAAKKLEEFTSFNDFFYRKLKPGARPIGSDVVSPGDGKLLAFQSVAQVHNFFVKGRKFTVSEFLGDAQLASKYEKGSMLILRLAPNDYHRYHFPYAGLPSKSTLIKGNYLSVSPYALASNFTRVFCENKREICSLHTPDKGTILLLPVGATMVGSIISTYAADQPVNKGDEMGYFAFGGSTVVMLFEEGQITIDEDLLNNTANGMETFIKMGERIGK